MAVITYLGTEYTVDHAVKGADFIHGYDADSVMVVSFEGISDFSGFSYNGTYMEPGQCLAEGCNTLKVVSGVLKRADGTDVGEIAASAEGQTASNSVLRNSKLVSADTTPTVNGEIYWTYA